MEERKLVYLSALESRGVWPLRFSGQAQLTPSWDDMFLSYISCPGHPLLWF